MALRVDLKNALLKQELSRGGWTYSASTRQAAIEPTCLSLLALRWDSSPARVRGVKFLLGMQNQNGSWPAFSDDDSEGSGLTALAQCSDQQRRDGPPSGTRRRMAVEVQRKRVTLALEVEVSDGGHSRQI